MLQELNHWQPFVYEPVAERAGEADRQIPGATAAWCVYMCALRVRVDLLKWLTRISISHRESPGAATPLSVYTCALRVCVLTS